MRPFIFLSRPLPVLHSTFSFSLSPSSSSISSYLSLSYPLSLVYTRSLHSFTHKTLTYSSSPSPSPSFSPFVSTHHPQIRNNTFPHRSFHSHSFPSKSLTFFLSSSSIASVSPASASATSAFHFQSHSRSSSSSSSSSSSHYSLQSLGYLFLLSSLSCVILLSLSPFSSSTVHSSSLSVQSKSSSYYHGQSPAGSFPDLRLFSGRANPQLAAEVASALGIPLSKVKTSQFADGECELQVLENVRECDVFIIQPISNPTNDNLMELLLLISTMRRSSAREITAVIPYYGYSRQDRKLASRIPIAAADVALMLEEMGVDRVVSVELHNSQVQGFFPPSCPCENLDACSVASLYFSEKSLKDPVVVSPSAAGVYRAKKFREGLVENGYHDTDLALLIENRPIDSAGRLEGGPNADTENYKLDLVGNVKDCDVIIVEDIIDSGATMQHAANELKRQGARNVYGFASHGLFSANSVKRIQDSHLVELVTTNSVPLTEEAKNNDKVTQLTLAPLLAEAIRRVYTNTSISSLFDHKHVESMVKKSPE